MKLHFRGELKLVTCSRIISFFNFYFPFSSYVFAKNHSPLLGFYRQIPLKDIFNQSSSNQAACSFRVLQLFSILSLSNILFDRPFLFPCNRLFDRIANNYVRSRYCYACIVIFPLFPRILVPDPSVFGSHEAQRCITASARRDFS